MSRKIMDPSALLCPVPPVLVSCGSVDEPNVMTAAWTGVINTHPPKCYVSIRPGRYSAELIKRSGELVINLTTESLAFAADFCGVRSGRQTDKVKACGLHLVPSAQVSAPTVDDSPLSLECRVTDVLPLGTHEMYLLDVVGVSVREELFDADGKIDLDRCGLIAYAHGGYYALGKKLGTFGWTVRKKKPAAPPSGAPSVNQVPKRPQKSTETPKKGARATKAAPPSSPSSRKAPARPAKNVSGERRTRERKDGKKK